MKAKYRIDEVVNIIKIFAYLVEDHKQFKNIADFDEIVNHLNEFKKEMKIKNDIIEAYESNSNNYNLLLKSEKQVIINDNVKKKISNIIENFVIEIIELRKQNYILIEESLDI